MKKKLYAYLLLDRTGSMSNKWQQAIASINEYVETLKANDTVDSYVEVVAWDQNSSWGQASVFGSTLGGGRTSVTMPPVSDTNIKVFPLASVEKWNKLTIDTLREHGVYPRGMTNLWDTVGKVLDDIKMENETCCVVVITDGGENCSKNYTEHTFKSCIKEYTETGKEVLFIGADFNVEQTAASYGMDLSKFLNATGSTLTSSLRGVAESSVLYASTGMAMNFTAEDKTAAIQ